MTPEEIASYAEITASFVVIIGTMIGLIQNANQNRIFERQNDIIAAGSGVPSMSSSLSEITRMRRFRTVLISTALAVLAWFGVACVSYLRGRIWLAIPTLIGTVAMLAWLVHRTHRQVARAHYLVSEAESVTGKTVLAYQTQRNVIERDLPMAIHCELRASEIGVLLGALGNMRSHALGTFGPGNVPYELDHPLSEKIFGVPIKQWRGHPVNIWLFQQAFQYLSGRIPALASEFPSMYSEKTSDEIKDALEKLRDKLVTEAKRLRDLCQKEPTPC